MFFFEKKNQKLPRMRCSRADKRVQTEKSFLLLFYKKEVLFFLR